MPENQSEGAAPEDLLFGDSSSANATEDQSAAATQTEPNPPAPAEPAPAATDAAVDENTIDADATAAEALGEPEAAEALGEGGEAEGDKAEREPTTYEDFDIPEGASTFGEPVVAAFSEVASELGLTQEQAQKVIDKIAPVQLEAQQSATTNTVKTWVDASRTDKEVGGANYRASLANAGRAMNRFASPEFRQLMTGKGTRLANHPEMLRFLSRVGAATSADRSLVKGPPAPATPKVNVNDPMSTQDATAELMFGTTDI